MILHHGMSSEGRQRRIKMKGLLVHIKEEKKLFHAVGS
jgi:hypothetical protein